MSKNRDQIDTDRYFNDPEYRKGISGNPGEDRPPETGPFSRIKNRLGKNYLRYLIGAAGFLFLMAAGYLFYLTLGLPSIEELENPRTAIATEVRSRDGAVLDRYFVENRTYVPIENISPHIVDALIATEDHRFYNHWGIDSQSLMRLPYYWIRQRFQGGSTISQQLARNL